MVDVVLLMMKMICVFSTETTTDPQGKGISLLDSVQHQTSTEWPTDETRGSVESICQRSNSSIAEECAAVNPPMRGC